MRIDELSRNNSYTQGAQRRTWLQQHAPQHLEQCHRLMLQALHLRQPSASRSVLVLGAGACTEVPLDALARGADEVALADLDLAAMQQGRAELSSPTLRRRVQIMRCDISGGVSANLRRLLAHQDWASLATQGGRAVFDAAAACLEQCPIPDPPDLPDLATSGFGVVISSLVLSQLFSYPLLDILDHIQLVAPDLLVEQERHRRYPEAAQDFRVRTIQSHLHLLRDLVDTGGIVALICDVRGFVFDVYGTDDDEEHRRAIPLVPRALPRLVRDQFQVIEATQWEWLTDLPEKGRPGRGYEVSGYILETPS